MPIHAIIVDDEPLARDLINEYLHEYPEIEVVAQCSNGRQAIEPDTGLVLPGLRRGHRRIGRPFDLP